MELTANFLTRLIPISQFNKGIQKVRKNPVSRENGGYSTPLGNKESNLTGLFKIKFLKYGIRVVYKLEFEGGIMKIIIVSARTDNKVYAETGIRHHL